jgi:hypothetical protein
MGSTIQIRQLLSTIFSTNGMKLSRTILERSCRLAVVGILLLTKISTANSSFSLKNHNLVVDDLPYSLYDVVVAQQEKYLWGFGDEGTRILNGDSISTELRAFLAAFIPANEQKQAIIVKVNKVLLMPWAGQYNVELSLSFISKNINGYEHLLTTSSLQSFSTYKSCGESPCYQSYLVKAFEACLQTLSNQTKENKLHRHAVASEDLLKVNTNRAAWSVLNDRSGKIGWYRTYDDFLHQRIDTTTKLKVQRFIYFNALRVRGILPARINHWGYTDGTYDYFREADMLYKLAFDPIDSIFYYEELISWGFDALTGRDYGRRKSRYDLIIETGTSLGTDSICIEYYGQTIACLKNSEYVRIAVQPEHGVAKFTFSSSEHSRTMYYSPLWANIIKLDAKKGFISYKSWIHDSPKQLPKYLGNKKYVAPLHQAVWIH